MTWADPDHGTDSLAEVLDPETWEVLGSFRFAASLRRGSSGQPPAQVPDFHDKGRIEEPAFFGLAAETGDLMSIRWSPGLGCAARCPLRPAPYWADPESGRLQVWNAASGESFAEPPPFEAGGGGHVSTVDDFLAFGRMLLGGGEYRGRRVLSEASVAILFTQRMMSGADDTALSDEFLALAFR